jgi:hypothetical protein
MTVKITANGLTALDEFTYKNGYVLTVTDLGSDGLRIELIHSYEGSAAVIMPSDIARRCAHWMLRSLAIREPQLPADLPGALHRLVSNKTLKRGEKRKIRDAIRILKSLQSD